VHVTTVFVTHDQEEAMEVADRIVVMNKGRIEQVGAPEEVYRNPATPFVEEFLGDVNVFRELELSREQARALGLEPGERVCIRPRRLRAVTAPEKVAA
jgi:ABC-type Fe3+/spermidine/putrescine transport system ATPase subunit